jgi:hypothetical protein
MSNAHVKVLTDTSKRVWVESYDRGVYRNGETVHLKGLLRQKVGSDWQVPAGRGLTAPVVAGGLVVVASETENCVTALHAAAGWHTGRPPA